MRISPSCQESGWGELLIADLLMKQQTPFVDELSFRVSCSLRLVCSWFGLYQGKGKFLLESNWSHIVPFLQSEEWCGKRVRLKPAKLASPCLLFSIYLTSSSFRKAQKHVFNNKHVQMCRILAINRALSSPTYPRVSPAADIPQYFQGTSVIPCLDSGVSY